MRRRGGEGVVRGVVARRVVGRRRSVHGRIRTIDFEVSRSTLPASTVGRQVRRTNEDIFFITSAPLCLLRVFTSYLNFGS